jgi:iron complex transport system permease protein
MFASYLAYLGGTVLPQFLGTLLPAALGALLTLGLVYLLGQRRGWIDPVSMLLVGVVVGTLCSALIMFLQHLVPTGLRGEFTTWLMGHVPEVTAAAALMVAATVVGVGLLVALAMADAMDVAMFSEDEARSIGLHLGRLRLGLFLLSGLLAATAVALVGPIGFVGLVAPHATRLLLGPRHRLLIAGSAVCGMIFLVGADLLRQALDFGAGRMPPGIFTALVGGPVFLYLLRRGRGGQWP